MEKNKTKDALILGAFICFGLVALGFFISKSVIEIKSLERTVTVKGLSEKEVQANIAIWPLKFSEAGNNLYNLTSSINEKNKRVRAFLNENGFTNDEISISAPSIIDKYADQYSNQHQIKYRYFGSSVINIYTSNVTKVKSVKKKIGELSVFDIAMVSDDYQYKTQFLFTKLNDVKPSMIEEATKNAREVAQKFATDSDSKLGKIKSARQGQFSIYDRDSNTPEIKKVRIVSTLVYYLTD
ncbi:MAG: SIMPL domain-containing protein [Ignavibacteriae bacterium]|nr:SIMPL domain-containing protein [Ignavibacteriota bacterium]